MIALDIGHAPERSLSRFVDAAAKFLQRNAYIITL